MNFKLQIEQLLLSNRRNLGNFQYTVPSPKTYPYQWLWDSCFNAIALSYFDINSAKKELLSLVSRQFENGLIPHIIYWQQDGGNFPKINWGVKGTSSITQPPMIAFALWEIYQKDKDKEFLKEIYPSLDKFYRYLLGERDPEEQHLAGIIISDESGEDNSPRFDGLLGLGTKQTKEENFKKRIELIEEKRFYFVHDVPFNSILIENLRVLSDIAEKIGLENEADFWINQSKKVKQAMRDLMLEDGIFWTTDRSGKKIKVKTWAIFAPLFAGVVTKEEASKLVENYLKNPDEFNLQFLIPTVSFSEKSFNPENMWRGPVWMGVNWFVFKGLKKYGFVSEAKKILDSTKSLLEKSGFREYYNPLTGEGLGAQNFTWGALILDMVMF